MQNWQDSESMTCHESQKLGFHVILFFGGSNVKKIIMHSRINMNISLGGWAGERGQAYFIEHELLPRKESQIKTSEQRWEEGGEDFLNFK